MVDTVGGDADFDTQCLPLRTVGRQVCRRSDGNLTNAVSGLANFEDPLFVCERNRNTRTQMLARIMDPNLERSLQVQEAGIRTHIELLSAIRLLKSVAASGGNASRKSMESRSALAAGGGFGLFIIQPISSTTSSKS
jgi:hypothetical protein